MKYRNERLTVVAMATGRLAPIDDLAEWMTNLPKTEHDVPLNQLAIPGSHDSFAFYLDRDGPITPGAPKVARTLGKLKLMKKIIYNWSVTQELTAHEQLKAGIRYFDIRTCPRVSGASRRPCFVHGLYGPFLDVTLRGVSDFLSSHPKEVVLLDFNTFYNMTDEDHEGLVALLKDTFRNKICPKSVVGNVTLTKLWANGWQVLVFYRHEETVVSADGHDFWPSRSIPSPWPNQQTPYSLISDLEKRYQVGKPADSFHVTQGVLTPSTRVIAQHVGKSLKAVLAAKAARPFVQWLQSKATGNDTGINICIMDFAEMENYIHTVVMLNYKK